MSIMASPTPCQLVALGNKIIDQPTIDVRPKTVVSRFNQLARSKKDMEFRTTAVCTLRKDESTIFPVMLPREGFFMYSVIARDSLGGLSHYILEDEETVANPLIRKIFVDNMIDQSREIIVHSVLF